MKKLVLLSIIFVLLSSCDRKEKGYIPEHLLSEQEMITIMTDVQIIEADINNQKSEERERNDTAKTTHNKDFVKLSRDYYAQLFEHYGITDSIFTQNIRYYTEHPAVLERIMDSVTQRLTSSIHSPTNH